MAQRQIPIVRLVVEVPQVQFTDKVFAIPVVAHGQFPTGAETVEVPQLLFDKVVVAQKHIPLNFWSEDHRGRSPWFGGSEDDGDSQLQFIDKVSPSCRGAEADLHSLTGVMRWFMAMVRRMVFMRLLAAFFGLSSGVWLAPIFF